MVIGGVYPVPSRDLVLASDIQTGLYVLAPSGAPVAHSINLSNGQVVSNVDFGNEPVTTQIIDNGDPGFSAPSFTPYDQGFRGDIHFSANGNGSNVATWTFGVTPGQYKVAATWTTHSNRAKDSPFTVFNGSTALSTIDLNQELAPSDFFDQGVGWEDLGQFAISGNELVVQLTNDANQYVIADAIRIERVGNPPPAGPEINVVANSVSIADGDTSPSTVDDTDFGTLQVSSGSHAHTFTIQNTGNAALNISSIGVAGGAASDFAVSGAPSSVAANGTGTFQVTFDPSVTGVRSTTLSISSNDADEATYDFTIQGTGSSTPPPPPSTTQIIDNGDAGFSAPSFTSYGQGFQGDIHFTAAGNGSSAATWTFTVTPGEYEVAATWTKHTNRAKDAPFTVLNGSSVLSTVDINQETIPNDFTDSGAQWERLGDFTITGTQLVVRLTNDADQYVIADAIRIERAADPPPPPPAGPEINVVGNGVPIIDGDSTPVGVRRHGLRNTSGQLGVECEHVYDSKHGQRDVESEFNWSLWRRARRLCGGLIPIDDRGRCNWECDSYVRP